MLLKQNFSAGNNKGHLAPPRYLFTCNRLPSRVSRPPPIRLDKPNTQYLSKIFIFLQIQEMFDQFKRFDTNDDFNLDTQEVKYNNILNKF